MKTVVVRSAPHETATVLREEILAYEGEEEEWLLGSEDEVLGQLGVSRPTLRQASRILEQEQLLLAAGSANHKVFLVKLGNVAVETDGLKVERLVLRAPLARAAGANAGLALAMCGL